MFLTLGHWWSSGASMMPLPSGCAALPFNIWQEKKLLLVPKRENDTRYMNIYDEHTFIKGRAALEKCSEHLGVYYLAQGHLSSTLKVSQHLSCYRPYNQNPADLLKF